LVGWGKFQRVEVFEHLTVPQVVTVDDGCGSRISVKERKCSWCKVESVMRRIPIIIPIP
jgi:hypothetical protein